MSDFEILFEHRGAIGLVTLNRPKALNALTHGMAVALHKQLEAWKSDTAVKAIVVRGEGERAFCAGGDIRTLYESGKAGTPYALDFYRDEYILNAAIKHYPKPYIALISGIVMGGGVGVSVHGSHRVADETTTFAMPETGIGLFPDVGGSYFLPRITGGLAMGLYLALTGTRLKGADAVHAGIATHFTSRANQGVLIEKLAAGEGIDAALKSVAAPLPEAPAHRDEIARIFSAPSVENLLERLDAESSDWAADTAKTIRTKSPTSTKLAFRQLHEGAKREFDGCMRMEFRMVNRIVAGHDFYEGVRATIIDKDNAPKWQPSSLAEVTDAVIDAYFAPLAMELPL